jgi:hypothetical protein
LSRLLPRRRSIRQGGDDPPAPVAGATANPENSTMLSVKSYGREHVDACRRRIAAQLAAYRALLDVAHKGDQGSELDGAVAQFEPAFFNTMVLALDNHFTHRARTVELKDGNPLNEVRMLCSSMTEHGGVFTADSTIRYKAEASVLGLRFGDEIQVTEDGFVRLCDAFLDEIEAKFP